MERHESQRGYFAFELYDQMRKNEDIWLLVGDLGFKVFDKHFEDFPDRCINVGASEQAMVGIAVGLALEGKIPFVYSITPFLINRAFETINLYLDVEQVPVKLVGSGRDKDYEHDGPSHDATNISNILNTQKSILQFWPEEKDDIPIMVEEMVLNKRPSFISLTR